MIMVGPFGLGWLETPMRTCGGGEKEKEGGGVNGPSVGGLNTFPLPV